MNIFIALYFIFLNFSGKILPVDFGFVSIRCQLSPCALDWGLRPLHNLHSGAQPSLKPLLIAYGGRDERGPLVHGERMREALRPHNPSVEWWVYPTAGHCWGDEATQVDFWARVEKFLAKHLAAKTQ